ncbi:hypothetical protein L6452_05422 [Arctium lappa]|uniref:Uncharacterized protein n=1 Tax=Arctium lappa TaxID=4217 RepID=A0ACB9EH13_ARCLA|nr:hypothetical protein L6452_05422 [Arctium lappa]
MGTSVNQPESGRVPPANAPRGDEAGSSNQPPQGVPYPYSPEEVIGGGFGPLYRASSFRRQNRAFPPRDIPRPDQRRRPVRGQVSNVGWLGLLSVARLGGQRALGCGGAIIAQFPNLMQHRVRTAGNRSMGGLRILLPPQGWLIAALSLYRDRGGIAQFFLEEGWFARVTDPAIMYSYLYYSTDTRSRAYIRRSSCVNSGEERKAVDDNEKRRRVWAGGMDELKVSCHGVGQFAFFSGGLLTLPPLHSHSKLRLLSKMHCDFLFCGRTYDPGREEKDFFLRRAFSRKAKDAPRQVPTVGKGT